MINRDEFDRLVSRVDRLELGQHATIELVASEVVALRTHLDEGFAAIDRRFEAVDRRFEAVDRRFEAVDGRMDGIERRVDLCTEQVGIAIEVGSAAVAENRRLNTAIIEHFGIEMPED